MLTKESNEFIKELKPKMKSKDLLESNHLKKLFHILESNTFEYESPQKKTFTKQYPDNSFIVPKLLKKAREYTRVTHFQWTVKSKYRINCSLSVYGKGPSLSAERLNLLIYALSFIMSLSDNNRTIRVHLTLLPDKKKYNSQKFTQNEINGGCSVFNKLEGDIYVWRVEECIKTLFHECIHCLNLSRIQDNDQIIRKYNKLYNNTSQKMSVDEAYTEVWAKILNCYFVARMSAFQHEDLDSYRYFCSLLAIEREFCLLQGHKVAKDLKEGIKRDINKDTNVVSYYIVTAEIFNNLKNFLSFCFRDNKPFYLKDQRLFNSFLMGCKKVPIRKLNQKSKSYATLRMTGIELKV